MKRLSSFFILFLSCFLTISAQTSQEITQAKTDFENSKYSLAMPIFKQMYELKPQDARVNMWYGTCLYKTKTDIAKAEQLLNFAVKKRISNAFLFLGDLYTEQYKITEAQKIYDKFLKLYPKQRSLLIDKVSYLDWLKQNIYRTEDIQIIDSVLVNKNDFLSAYHLSNTLGSLNYYKNTFSDIDRKDQADYSVFFNGTKSRIYFSAMSNDTLRLYSMDKLINGEYGNRKKLSENNFGLLGDVNYPFVLSDGVTLYFAAKDKDNLGGYDIYVTRYNTNSDSFLNPERLNMPFNSIANDYLLVIDEKKGIGWFATDRFQDADKVCVYTFIPNETTKVLKDEDLTTLEQRARISSIKASQQNNKDYTFLRSLARKDQEKAPIYIKKFTFVINDSITYYRLSDFKNIEAKNGYQKVISNKEKIKILFQRLKNKREQYLENNNTNNLNAEILTLEKEIEQLEVATNLLEVKIRNLEIKHFN